MAETKHKHREREPKHEARKKAEPKSLWGRLKKSALFLLLLIVVFIVAVVAVITLIARLLSNQL